MTIGSVIHDIKLGVKKGINTVLSGIFGQNTATTIEDAFTAGVHSILAKLPEEVLPLLETAGAAAMAAETGGVDAIIKATIAAALPGIEKLGVVVEDDVLHTASRIVVTGLQAAAAAGNPAKPAVGA